MEESEHAQTEQEVTAEEEFLKLLDEVDALVDTELLKQT